MFFWEKKITDTTWGEAYSVWAWSTLFKAYFGQEAREAAQGRKAQRLLKEKAKLQAKLDADPAYQAQQRAELDAFVKQEDEDREIRRAMKAEMRAMGLDPKDADDRNHYLDEKAKGR
jgi:hypothetical protein